ncbi:MAG TPA: phosphohistidine phosphatase SixA [Gammaproteobacteria bacterium]
MEPSRALTDEGRREVESLARIALHFEVPLRRIEHSGKLRAQQTAEVLESVLRPRDGVGERAGLGPNDDVAALAAGLGDCDGLMLVGHLPSLERLVGLLVAGDAGRRVLRMQNGGILALDDDDGDWTIRWSLLPHLG